MKTLLVSTVIAVTLAFPACSRQERVSPEVDPRAQPVEVVKSNRPEYSQALAAIASRRQALFKAYSAAQGPQEKQRVLSKAREFLVLSIAETIFPYWYGTPWDFNGTTRTPGKGKIACGYFVSTILQDIGLQVERVRMAQQPSELIIKSLTSEKHIRRFSNASIKKFVASVKEWGPGLYVVGLDQHTGFVLQENSEVFFVHSSYVKPKVVVKERALQSPILSASKYRVLGKISGDDALLIKWLRETKFKTQTL